MQTVRNGVSFAPKLAHCQDHFVQGNIAVTVLIQRGEAFFRFLAAVRAKNFFYVFLV